MIKKFAVLFCGIGVPMFTGLGATSDQTITLQTILSQIKTAQVQCMTLSADLQTFANMVSDIDTDLIGVCNDVQDAFKNQNVGNQLADLAGKADKLLKDGSLALVEVQQIANDLAPLLNTLALTAQNLNILANGYIFENFGAPGECVVAFSVEVLPALLINYVVRNQATTPTQTRSILTNTPGTSLLYGLAVTALAAGSYYYLMPWLSKKLFRKPGNWHVKGEKTVANAEAIDAWHRKHPHARWGSHVGRSVGFVGYMLALYRCGIFDVLKPA